MLSIGFDTRENMLAISVFKLVGIHSRATLSRGLIDKFGGTEDLLTAVPRVDDPSIREFLYSFDDEGERVGSKTRK